MRLRAPVLALALLALLPAPAAVAAPLGKYAGETEQERPFRFTVAGGGRLISALTFRFDVPCEQQGVRHRGSSRVTNIPLTAKGTFRTSGDYRAPAGDGLEAHVYETLTGRVRNDGTAAGTVTVRSVIRQGDAVVHRCSAPPQRWAAVRR